VAKLLILARPNIAVFGEKDYQQLLIVRRMVADLALPVEILGAPIVRDVDGLALSSRNQYLSLQQRALAPQLHRTLLELAAALARSVPDEPMRALLEQQASASLTTSGFRVDYIAIRDAGDLGQPRRDSTELVVLAAAWLGTTRLIDNLRVSYAGA
jgi:pantoate--beta-alanine ligase